MGQDLMRRSQSTPVERALCLVAALGLVHCVPEVSYDEASTASEAGAEWSETDAEAGGAGRQQSSSAASSSSPESGSGGGRVAGASGGDRDDSSAVGPSTETTTVAAGCADLESEALVVLETHCSNCHGPGTNVVFDTVLDPAALERTGKILPGNADGSPLFRRISGGNMPPASVAERPTQDEIDVLAGWISQCLATPTATAQDNGCGLPEISQGDVLSAMVVDMLSTDLDDRPFIRYFTLDHVVNSGGCEEDLVAERFALAKAVNALSLGTSVVVPTAVDSRETVLRVDIRDYEWDAVGGREDKWELLVDANPYAFVLESDDAELLQTFAQTDVPFQSASWFVHDATQPPLYHDMLDIPATFAGLEDQLDVNVVDNILSADVVRAGFLDSGVSGNNRVIERHELPSSGARSLWISYDFANDGGDENVFADPLAFDADGSEIIFTLPNGLHGYMVADAAGTRLDEAPTQIVVDDQQPDRNVRNGISCMSCHVEGIKPKTDELRAHVLSSRDFDDNEVDEVLRVYPPAEEFNAIVERDADLFKDTVAALTPQDAPAGEPIIKSFNRFEANVSLAEAAAELGIEPQVLLRELGALSPELAPLAEGTVKRSTFQDLFPETVCLLNLGLANDEACRRSSQSLNNNEDEASEEEVSAEETSAESAAVADEGTSDEAATDTSTDTSTRRDRSQ